jgi:hypothetical protein
MHFSISVYLMLYLRVVLVPGSQAPIFYWYQVKYCAHYLPFSRPHLRLTCATYTNVHMRKKSRCLFVTFSSPLPKFCDNFFTCLSKAKQNHNFTFQYISE